MKKIFFIFGAGIALLVGIGATISSPTTAFSAEGLFTTNLALGIRDPQVFLLQRILNKSFDTRISDSGPGSPGLETDFFGPLTREAVIRFQNKYAAEILIPAGLSQGNGFVGPLTRQKLNMVSSQQSSSGTTASAQTIQSHRVLPTERTDIHFTDKAIQSYHDDMIAIINQSIADRKAPQIDFSKYDYHVATVAVKGIYPQVVKSGQTVSLSGQGYDPISNNIYIGPNYIIRAVPSKYNSSITFTVPDDIPPGKYDLVVSNKYGMSRSVVFIITTATQPVTITAINPSKIKYGTSVTIIGTGFSPTGNDVYTTFGTVHNVPSPDGKTLTFTYGPAYMSEVVKTAIPGSEYPFQIWVVSESGMSAPQTATLVL